MRVRLILLAILLAVVLVSVSCDRGIGLPSISLSPKNITYAKSPTGRFDMTVKGYYYEEGGHYWVILERTGVTRPAVGRWYDLIVVCFDETVDSGNPSHEFRSALKVYVSGLGTGFPLVYRWAKLEKDTFSAERSGKFMRVVYDSKITDNWVFGEAWDRERTYWLRFNVKAKRNQNKILSIVRDLYPLLEEEEYAGEVLECLKPLIDDQAK